MGQASAEDRRLVIKNVEIFDGVSDRLRAGHVLVEGQRIGSTGC